MAPAAATITRSLPAIVLDLRTTRSRLASVMADVGHGTPSSEQDALCTSLERRFEALDLEFRDTFKAMTGIDWDRAKAVMS